MLSSHPPSPLLVLWRWRLGNHRRTSTFTLQKSLLASRGRGGGVKRLVQKKRISTRKNSFSMQSNSTCGACSTTPQHPDILDRRYLHLTADIHPLVAVCGRQRFAGDKVPATECLRTLPPEVCNGSIICRGPHVILHALSPVVATPGPFCPTSVHSGYGCHWLSSRGCRLGPPASTGPPQELQAARCNVCLRDQSAQKHPETRRAEGTGNAVLPSIGHLQKHWPSPEASPISSSIGHLQPGGTSSQSTARSINRISTAKPRPPF